MTYNYLILPIIAFLIAQSSKFFIKSNKTHFSWRAFFAYSGMPSSHSAFIISLITIIGLQLDIKSPEFAIAFIFGLVVIRDATGLRRYVGRQGKTINALVEDLSNDEVLENDYPHLLEKVGHTPLQVIIGSLIGFFTSLIGYLL